MRKDNRLARIMETHEQYKDRRQSEVRLAFERKIVRKLLDAGGVTSLQRRVMESKWIKGDQQDYYLTFGWFMEEFPDFPFSITASHETWKPRALEVFMSSSRTSSIWRRWDELKEEFSKEALSSRQFALFVPCSQESGLSPAMVLHNGELRDGPFEESVPNRVQVRMTEPRTEASVFLQHIKYFVSQVSLQWTAL